MKYILSGFLLIFLLNCQNNANRDIAEAVKSAPQPVQTASNQQTTIPQNNSAGFIELALDVVKSTPGATVCVPMRVGNFQGILSIQHSINWDTKLLKFDHLEGFNLPGLNEQNFGIPLASKGQLTFLWIENSLTPVNLEDGSIIYQVCYQVLDETPKGKVDIAITPDPTPFESVNFEEKVLEIKPTNGGVEVE